MLLFAALIFKIAAGTVCVLDGPSLASSPSSSDHTLTVGAVQADTLTGEDEEACLLGESSGCHCACAHAVAMPMDAPSVAAVVGLPDVVKHVPAAPVPLVAPSPLRPPIA